ncbi:MAG: DegV family EDD domain-containing protein [Lachnospiraceae bacterium]|nr:DegV family EDD domain-containing protein [Lachnospiraceae bacterium]
MKNWIIVAESGSDITYDEAKELGIELVPMHVTMGGKSYDDGTFPAEDICNYYKEHKELPKTSGSVPADFISLYDRIHAEHPQAQILHLAYSAVTTISYNSSLAAAEGRDYVTAIDTKHVSVGQRAVVLQTLDLLKNEPGIAKDRLLKKVRAICDHTKMSFLPADLAYLHAGGRCTNLELWGSRLLHLHPCIEILDGKLIATTKYRGSFQKVVKKLVRDCAEKNHLTRERLWLVRTPGLSEETRKIAEDTAKELGFGLISWVKTGCVITTHGGEGAIGVVGIAEV